MIHSRGGTSFKSENASVMLWKSYLTGETQIKDPYTHNLGCWRDIKLTSSQPFLISLQPVSGVEMVGWIKGGYLVKYNHPNRISLSCYEYAFRTWPLYEWSVKSFNHTLRRRNIGEAPPTFPRHTYTEVIRVMHQSFVSPAPSGPGIPGT